MVIAHSDEELHQVEVVQSEELIYHRHQFDLHLFLVAGPSRRKQLSQ